MNFLTKFVISELFIVKLFLFLVVSLNNFGHSLGLFLNILFLFSSFFWFKKILFELPMQIILSFLNLDGNNFRFFELNLVRFDDFLREESFDLLFMYIWVNLLKMLLMLPNFIWAQNSWLGVGRYLVEFQRLFFENVILFKSVLFVLNKILS